MPASTAVAVDKHHHIGIDLNPLRLRQVGPRQRGQGLHADVREQEPETAADSRDDHILGEDAPSDPPS